MKIYELRKGEHIPSFQMNKKRIIYFESLRKRFEISTRIKHSRIDRRPSLFEAGKIYTEKAFTSVGISIIFTIQQTRQRLQ